MTDPDGPLVTVSGTPGDRLDEVVVYRLRASVLTDQGVRDLLWRLAVGRPSFRLPSPWLAEPNPRVARLMARLVPRIWHDYYQQVADLASRGDGHFTVDQLDAIIEQLQKRCILDLDALDLRPPHKANDVDLLAFEVLPMTAGWRCDRPGPERVRGEDRRTVEHAAASIAARMAGRAQTWTDADRIAAEAGDWHSTPEIGGPAVRQYRLRLRRRRPTMS